MTLSTHNNSDNFGNRSLANVIFMAWKKDSNSQKSVDFATAR